MNKYRVSCFPIVLFSIIAPFSICLWIMIFALILSPDSIYNIVTIVTIQFVVLYGIFFAIHHNVYKITEYGVSNKHTIVNWEEMSSYKIYEITILNYSLLPTLRLTPIVCFGNFSPNSSLWLQNCKSCVWLPLTKENVNMIRKQCEIHNIDIDLSR